jgi:type I restriction enzyme S subunit
MSEWEEIKLGNLVFVKKGKLARLSPIARDGYLPYIGSTVLEGRIEAFAEASGGELATEKDVLMLWDGERSGLVGKGLRGVVGSTVARLTPRDGVDTKFLFHALSYKFEWIQALRTGTGVPHVPKDLCDILIVALPKSIIEQRNIAQILDTVDEATQRTEQLIAKLKAIKQGLLHDLLTRGLDENGQLRDPIAHPEQFKDSPLGRIPKEWEYGPLKEFVDFMPGFGFPLEFQGQTDGEFPFFKVSDMELAENNRYMIKANNYVNQKMVLKQGWKLIPGEAVVFAKVGAALLLNRRRITTCSCLVDNNMMAAVTKKDIINRFLYWWMTCLDFGQFVQTTALPSVNQTQLGQVLIAFPKSKEEQLQIVSSIDLNDTLIEKEMIFLTKLKSIKKGLLHDLLTGKVRVNIKEGNRDQVEGGNPL